MKSVSFWGLLALLFIGLKLSGAINWSWWLVLLPLYGFALIKIGGVLLLIIIGLLAGNQKKEEVKPKSKWQERLEELQKAQTERSKK